MTGPAAKATCSPTKLQHPPANWGSLNMIALCGTQPSFKCGTNDTETGPKTQTRCRAPTEWLLKPTCCGESCWTSHQLTEPKLRTTVQLFCCGKLGFGWHLALNTNGKNKGFNTVGPLPGRPWNTSSNPWLHLREDPPSPPPPGAGFPSSARASRPRNVTSAPSTLQAAMGWRCKPTARCSEGKGSSCAAAWCGRPARDWQIRLRVTVASYL